ncbi:sialidase-3-like [Rhinichthys klamathensis goyatoka]|uniref:sialidase-3-like n=1 Tax=Rhinichthys klamathensis goyatoka TaxID=3034132 RepID=UPI0024B5D41B|nr:sialidase-3-like [Rhinichthys klamathensis goyatoka]
MGNNTSSIRNSIPPNDITATTLFEQEPEVHKKQVTYRIPALIYISAKQTYLAFAEKRKTSDDTDAEVLVMRRGWWNDKNIEWDSDHLVLNSALLPNHRSMNPCPVYEKDSDTLFLFFICVPFGVSENDQMIKKKNQAQLCYITSKDTGRSWSDIANLNDVISEKEKHWATFAVGPGHGFQMESGRLIIPAYVYYFDSKSASSSPISHAFAFYSDDKGSTWHVGDQMEDLESGECQMAEIMDKGTSTLYCNARSKSGYRVEALSVNGGKTLKELKSAQLIETGKYGCQGSVLKIISSDQSTGDQSTWLLYSHPSDKKERKDLTIYVNKSLSDPMQWTTMKCINEGPSGYSDLAECEDQKYIACLFECGQKSEIEKIDFKLSDINNTTGNLIRFPMRCNGRDINSESGSGCSSSKLLLQEFQY